MRYLIGIDGGATGCRAIVSDLDGNRLGFGTAGPANIMVNFDTAMANIAEACEVAFAKASIATNEISNSEAYLGLAGANAIEYAKRAEKCLPFKSSIVVNDSVTSLEGAIGSKDGAVAIIGTGSVFIYRINGEVKTVGGWGYMIGDLGSGSRLGRELLQETLLAYDHIHPASDITKQVLAQFEDDPNRIVEYATKAEPGEFGTFAPLIFKYYKDRDPVAREILRNAIHDIEETLDAILIDESQNFCMLGGLGELYANLINSNLQKRILPPLSNAVSGAVSLAVRSFGNGATQ